MGWEINFDRTMDRNMETREQRSQEISINDRMEVRSDSRSFFKAMLTSFILLKSRLLPETI